MNALVEAIIKGRLTHRQARIALAVATGGKMGARRLEAVTGIDRAHCVRALAELVAMGWIARDGDGARPVDNSAEACAESAHGVCRKSTQGVPNQHTCAEKAHVPESAPVAESGGRVPKEHTPLCSSGSSYLNTTTTTHHGEDAELVFPNGFTAEQQKAAKHLLAPINGQAQALLDEMAGRAAIHPIKNQLAYLRGLVQRAQGGVFIPEAGISVAEARHRAEQARKLRKEQEDVFTAEIKKHPPPAGALESVKAALHRPGTQGRAHRTGCADAVGAPP